MAKLAIKKASTDVTVYCFIQDSSKTTGEGLAGLAYNTASLVGSYVRPAAARAALSLATQTVDGAHSDGGFVEVDATNMPGVYRLDLPDAVCATGVNSAVVMLKGAANMAPLLLELQLTDFDLNDASPNVSVLDMATDVLTAAAVKADAVTKIQNGLATPTNITAAAGVALSAAGIDAILDEVVVGSYTMRQLLKVMAAAMAGKVSGGGTSTITFRGVDDASNVIVATVDASGNRSAVTLTV